jgi:hypothetical protein
MHNELSGIWDVVVNSAPDFLLLLGMLMLGMALGALLTHIRHKALTAKIVQEFESKLRFQTEMVREAEKNGSANPDAA